MEDVVKNVCVVDDDLSIGEVISAMLEIEGYHVNFYKSGREGLDFVKENKPDLVLLDYFLPGESAEDIVKNLRSAAGDSLPIILMSASRQAEQAASELEVSEFIAKPFQREALLDALVRNLN